MSKSDTPQSYFEQVKQSWSVLTQTGVWILMTTGGFLLPPPSGVSDGENNTSLQLARFVVPVIVGLVFVAARKWDLRKHTGLWWGTAFVALICAVITLLSYQRMRDSWTVNYYGKTTIIGTEKTDQGQRASKEAGTNEDLLKFFAGKAEDAWTKSSIDRNRTILSAAYLSNLPLFTICLIAVVQSIHCVTKTRKPH